MTAYEQRSYPGAATQTTLAAPITASALNIPVVSAAGYADGTAGPAFIIIDYDNSKAEKVRYTSLSGNTYVVPATGGRGQDGTTAQDHAAGAKVLAVWTATDAAEANKAVVNTIGKVTTKGDLLAGTAANALGRVPAGADGTILIYDSTQTAGIRSGSNPTLTAPTITNPTLNGSGGALTLPAGPDTLVGRATTDTLTNKTLNGATLDAASTVGGVSGTALADERAAWTPYTPTFTNCTSPTGNFAYRLVGKALYVRGYFLSGTATGNGVVGVSLPPGVTAVTGASQYLAGTATFGVTNWTVGGGGTTITSVAAYGAGNGLNPGGFTGVIEVQ